MTISTSPDYYSDFTSYGLITPPSEMRSIIDNNPISDANNILAPPTNQRYNLRKTNHPQSLYPTPNGTVPTDHYNSYVQLRRGSASSSSTTATSSVSLSNIRTVSPTFSFDSRDFSIGEFTAIVLALVKRFFLIVDDMFFVVWVDFCPGLRCCFVHRPNHTPSASDRRLDSHLRLHRLLHSCYTNNGGIKRSSNLRPLIHPPFTSKESHSGWEIRQPMAFIHYRPHVRQQK